METKERLVITEDRLNSEQGHSYELGLGSGMENAAGILMEAATGHWRQGRDREAELLRTIAGQIKNAGEEKTKKARGRKMPSIYVRSIPADVPDSEGEE